MRVLSALFAVLLFVPLAAAQSDAPPPSPDAMMLYAHNADGSDELVGWSNTLESDGDDIAMGPSGNCDTHTGNDVDFTLVPPSQDVDRTYQLPLLPEQQGTLVLDTAGTIQATLHIGAGSCYGEVDVTARLVSGDTVVAEGTVTGHQYNDAGSDPYPTADIEMAPIVEEVDLASLVWEVDVVGSTGGAVFMSVSADRGMTNLALPILELRAEPGVVHHDVDDEDLTIALELANTTANHRYNWSQGPEAAVLFAQGRLSGGEVAVQVVDADNMTVYEEIFTGPINATQQLAGSAGNWTIHLNATAATGNLTLLLGPPAPSGGDGGDDGAGDGDGDGSDGGDGPDGDGGDAGAGTGNETSGGDEDAPALPWIAVAIGVLALASRRRT